MIAERQRGVAAWLLLCCAMLWTLIVVGALTRLTRSGLSIVEWAPLSGTLPPLSDAAWNEAFDAYKATPEYQIVNHGMSLADFQRIFWWEYVHRLIGRGIGLVLALPLLFLIARRVLRGGLAARLVALVALGGAQGGIGWIMVKSGLVDLPHVNPVKLTLHLGMGVLIFAGMWWTALQVAWGPRRGQGGAPAGLAAALAAFVFVVIVSGGLVAGTRAGYAWNTFPLMGGEWVPPGMLTASPWWLNFLENITTVQFAHRCLALMVLAGVFGAWTWVRRSRADRKVVRAFDVMLGVATLQVALGILTLLTRVSVPLAAAHQGTAVLLLASCIAAAMIARRAPANGLFGTAFRTGLKMGVPPRGLVPGAR